MDYKDIDGNAISLYKLVRQEPEWAASRITVMTDEMASLQSKIDALMLEYCPEDMTKEQMAEYELHQEIVNNPESK